MCAASRILRPGIPAKLFDSADLRPLAVRVIRNSYSVLGTWLAVLVVAGAFVLLVHRPGTSAPHALSVDSGLSAPELAALVGRGGPWSGWVRVHGSGDRITHRGINSGEGLVALRRAGLKTLVSIQGDGYPWPSGVRRGQGRNGTLPLDLREAFDRGYRLAARQRGWVDAWEIDNEPELSYVRENPETYAAYLKATYLGIKAARPRAQVLMAPMALPPGPYFEALLENGLLSYTDGFNFHYYGFAQDFPGVCERFRDAVEKFRPQVNGGEGRPRRKELPVFVSEFGYGLLSRAAAQSIEGRVRQWEFFREMHGHISALGITAPMAFVLRPYLEDGAREFGLMIAAGPHHAARGQFEAGGLRFSSRDFGANETEPWMRLIGTRWGAVEASPALAWLMAQPPNYERQRWHVVTQSPSPVVLDFIAGEGMHASKSSRGHYLLGGSGERVKGEGALVVYNFSSKSIAGKLRVSGNANEMIEQALVLPPRARIVVPVSFDRTLKSFAGFRWEAVFCADDDTTTSAPRYSSWIYPEIRRFREILRTHLRHSAAEAVENAATIDARVLARGEAPLSPSARWRVTRGLSVHEENGKWLFTVSGFPDEPMRPAVAELPLPDGFRFDRFSCMRGTMRLLPRTTGEVAAVSEPRSEIEFSALDREVLSVNVRTAQGSLFVPSMHFPVSTHPMEYTQLAANLTAVFYGRTSLPWRFFDHHPVSLVLMFRPRLLPARYEITNFRIVDYGAR